MYADRIKEKKKQFGWTTDELAIRSGVPTGTINKILNGETKSPRYDTMQALDDAFKEEEEKIDFVREITNYGSNAPERKYTVEDYYNFPKDVRVELIDGKVFFMEAPSTRHQTISMELSYQFVSYIRNRGGKCKAFAAPVDVQLDCDDDTMVQPDFIIVCNEDIILKEKIYGAPDFVIEILSPSSRLKDGGTKLGKYILAGVREYWIIDPEKEKVVCYEREDDFMPHIYNISDEIPVMIFQGELKINLDTHSSH